MGNHQEVVYLPSVLGVIVQQALLYQEIQDEQNLVALVGHLVIHSVEKVRIIVRLTLSSCIGAVLFLLVQVCQVGPERVLFRSSLGFHGPQGCGWFCREPQPISP